MLFPKSVSTVSALGLIAICGCSMTITNGYRFDFKGQQESKALNIEIPPETTELDLTNLHGDITITTSQDGTTNMQWDVTCWADTAEEADRQLEQIQFVSSIESGVITCEVQLPTEDKKLLRGVKSNFTLVLPESIAVNVHNSHGEIKAHNVRSQLDLDNRHGNIQAISLSQPCKITNAHGNIELQDVVTATVTNAHGDTLVTSVNDSLKLWSAHGSITVNDALGDVDVTTSHDDIFLTNINGFLVAKNSHGDISGTQLNGSKLDVETTFGNMDLISDAPEINCVNQHGAIKLTATNPSVHKVTAKTSFDSVTISLPGNCQPHTKTSCTFGDITSEFKTSTKQGPTVDVNVQHGDIRFIALPTAEKR